MTSKLLSSPLNELVCFVSKGITPKYVSNSSEGAICVLNQKTNRDFKINYKLARWHDLSKREVPDKKILRVNDILINSTGVGTAGRVAQLLKVPKKTTVDSHMLIVRPNEDLIDPVYLGYALKVQQNIIENLQEGSTGQTELNKQRLLQEIIIQFPEEKRQQNWISKLLLSIDEKILLNSTINHHLGA